MLQFLFPSGKGPLDPSSTALPGLRGCSYARVTAGWREREREREREVAVAVVIVVAVVVVVYSPNNRQ